MNVPVKGREFPLDLLCENYDFLPSADVNIRKKSEVFKLREICGVDQPKKDEDIYDVVGRKKPRQFRNGEVLPLREHKAGGYYLEISDEDGIPNLVLNILINGGGLYISAVRRSGFNTCKFWITGHDETALPNWLNKIGSNLFVGCFPNHEEYLKLEVSSILINGRFDKKSLFINKKSSNVRLIE